jgi:hypothetical protein
MLIKNGLQITDAVNCGEDFYALDHHNVAKNALKTMEQLGGNYYDYDTDEGMTADQVDELVEEYERYSEWNDDCIGDLKAYFPKIEKWWELNTGDY